MKKKDIKTPMGTVVLLIFFILLTSALWANVYIVMWSRGGTQ